MYRRNGTCWVPLQPLLVCSPFTYPNQDSLINAGQSFLNSQSGGQQQQQQQQGGGGGGGFGGFDLGDISGLVSKAQNHDQSGSGNQQLFGQVASFLQSKQNNIDGNIDEQQLLQNHDKVNNSNDQVGSGEIGNAAALGAIKNVLGGSGGGGSGGDFQQKLIGAAMAHAGQLFDSKAAAGQATGDKQDAMQQAGEAVMKLMVKHQMTSMIGGGGSGGLGSLLSMLA